MHDCINEDIEDVSDEIDFYGDQSEKIIDARVFQEMTTELFVLLMWVDFCFVLCKSAGAGLVNWWDCSSCLVAMCMWIILQICRLLFFRPC